jgi:hypothetical protein
VPDENVALTVDVVSHWQCRICQTEYEAHVEIEGDGRSQVMVRLESTAWSISGDAIWTAKLVLFDALRERWPPAWCRAALDLGNEDLESEGPFSDYDDRRRREEKTI